MKGSVTQKRLKELLSYNKKTGIFTRLVASGPSKKGSIAGYKNDQGYTMIPIDYGQYRAHRLAWLYIYGYLPENEIDHINRNRSDNKISNLRVVSRTCNLRNSGVQKRNTSGVTGVRWRESESKWTSFIGVNKKYVHLGIFRKKVDAVKARWEGEKEYNFPSCRTTSTAYLYLKNNGVIK